MTVETIRELLCAREREYLSSAACLSENSRGREKSIGIGSFTANPSGG